ncbi:NAD-specific glutamate dehydrogenase [Celeribacter baekdonensis B30]|uniref:NAD-specific glutamate dehydrogenase n=1 Tax=Celeribacter baekdonensis B30 TaxID=1208323 RepID=K2JJ46_9RHOB|nr:NAD-specific glutamate dehydrogenase [Celeribacter baekdonensis B30]
MARFALFSLINGLTELHGSVSHVLNARTDFIRVFGFKLIFERSNRKFDGFNGGRINLVVVLFDRLFSRVNEAFGLVFRFDQCFAGLIGVGICLGVFDHFLDVLIGEATRGLDRDLLLFAGAFVFGAHLDDTVGVDVKGHFDLRHAARCGRDAFEVELAQHFVVGGHLAFTLEHAKCHGGLVVLGGGEDLRLFGRDRGVAVDQTGEHATQRFDANGQRGHIKQQHVFHVTLQYAGLNGGAHGNHFVRVHTFVRLFAEEFGHLFDDFRHTGHPANQHDFVDVRGGETGIFESSLTRFDRVFDQVVHKAFQLRTGQFDHEVKRRAGGRVHGNERLVDLGLAGGRQFDLGFFSRFFEALKGHFVFGQIDAMLFFELTREVVHDAHVEIFTTKERVAVGGLHFKHAITEFEDGHVECPAAKVIDRDGFGFGFVEAIGQSRSCRLVDDPQHFEASNLTGVFGGLALGVVKVSRNRDDGLGHFFAEIGLGGFFHLAENKGGDLRRRIFVATHFNPSVTIAAIDDAVGNEALVLFHFGVTDATTDQTFDGEHCVLRVGHSLTFGRLTNEAFIVGKADDRRRGTCTFSIFNNPGLRTIHDGNAGVGGPEVDTDDFGHAQNPLLGDVKTRGPFWHPPLIPVILTDQNIRTDHCFSAYIRRRLAPCKLCEALRDRKNGVISEENDKGGGKWIDQRH